MRATAADIARLSAGKPAKPPRPLEKDVQAAVLKRLKIWELLICTEHLKKRAAGV